MPCNCRNEKRNATVTKQFETKITLTRVHELTVQVLNTMSIIIGKARRKSKKVHLIAEKMPVTLRR